MNLSEATKLVALLKGAYLREQFTEDSPAAYQWLLNDLPYGLVVSAAEIHGKRSKWCPTPAELRDIIAEQRFDETSPGEAWNLVLKQVRTHGRGGFNEVTFEDPAIMDAVKAVGWRRICDEETKYILPEFNKAFGAAQRRNRLSVQDGNASLSDGGVISLPQRSAS